MRFHDFIPILWKCQDKSYPMCYLRLPSGETPNFSQSCLAVLA